MQPWLLGILHCSFYVFPPELSEGEPASLSQKPQWVLSHNHRKSLGKGLLLQPSARSHYQGPGPALPIHSIFHSLLRARYPLGQDPVHTFPISPILAQSSSPGLDLVPASNA